MATATASVFPTLQSFAATCVAWLEAAMQRGYEASAIAQDIEALNRVSDEDLALQGLTREQAMRNLASRYGHF